MSQSLMTQQSKSFAGTPTDRQSHAPASSFLRFGAPLRVLALAALLAACGGGPRQIVERQCPPVQVLAPADLWQSPADETARAALSKVSLICFKDNEKDQLTAQVTLEGEQTTPGIAMPLFTAVLGEDDNVLMRTQYEIKKPEIQFIAALPPVQYALLAQAASKRRLVVGFVLSEAQLAANRAVWRDRLNMTE